MIARAHKIQRTRRIISSASTTHVNISNKALINFSSNDYLGLSQEKSVKKTLAHSAMINGTGYKSSPMISGYSHSTRFFEEAFSDYVGAEKSLFLNSGYHANLAVTTSIASHRDTIIADKHIHASIIDGIRITGAKQLRYKHQCVDHLNLRLKNTSQCAAVITESVFSMEGLKTPIKKIQTVCDNHNTLLIIDDAHGFGVIGTANRAALGNLRSKSNDLIVTPLAKGLGGYGAMISGSSDSINRIIQSARSYCYSSALPICLIDANHAALQALIKNPWRHEKLQENIDYVNSLSITSRLGIAQTQSAIIIMPLPNAHTAKIYHEYIFNKGFLIHPIRPPTVSIKHCCLRITITCEHSLPQLKSLINILIECHEYHNNQDKKIIQQS
jgi:8-amino-7-oxononanoate synthase